MKKTVACADGTVARLLAAWLPALGAVRVNGAPEGSGSDDVALALRRVGLTGSIDAGAFPALATVQLVVGPAEGATPCPVEGGGDRFAAAMQAGVWAGDWLQAAGLRRAFGDAVRPAFHLADDCVYLNHGSFGATPRAVLDAQHGFQEELEQQPTAFMQTVPSRLRAAMERVAPCIGAPVADAVFVDNATTGVMAVLRSLGLGPGDAILVTGHAYAAVQASVAYIAERTGCTVRVADVPACPDDEQAVVDAVLAAMHDDVRVAVLDHIASVSGVVFPLHTLVPALQARGVWVLVDGAHAPGHLPVDVQALGADWYVGNLHKWCFTPKGCGVLYARPELQEGLEPLVVSHGFGQGFAASFEWQGTRDPSAWLASGAALDFVATCGGFDVVRVHNRLLVEQGARILQDRLGLVRCAPPSLCGAMVSLVVPELRGWEAARGLVHRLWSKHRVQSFAGALADDTVVVRISAQIYNTPHDIVQLAEALAACR